MSGSADTTGLTLKTDASDSTCSNIINNTPSSCVMTVSTTAAATSTKNDQEQLQQSQVTKMHSKPRNPWIKSSITPSKFTATTSSSISFQSIMDQQEKEKIQSSSFDNKNKVSIINTKDTQVINNNNRLNDLINVIHEDEDEEELMIRLAIEASLKDQKNNNNDHDVFDGTTNGNDLTSSSSFHDYYYKDTSTVAAIADPSHHNDDHNLDHDIHNDDDSLSNNNNEESGMDEDMKLAIRLSLQESHNQLVQDRKISGDIASDSHCHNDDDEKSSCDQNIQSQHRCDSNNDNIDASTSLSIAAAPASASVLSSTSITNTLSFLTKEEEEQVAKAIMDADDKEMAKSIQLAMKLQEEEELQFNDYHKSRELQLLGNNHSNHNNTSNIRLISQYEYDDLKQVRKNDNYNNNTDEERQLWGKDDYDLHQLYYGNDIHHDNDETTATSMGFQMNSSVPSNKWSRLDKNTIIGPNNEIRTKHDVPLKNQVNAEKLLLSSSSVSSATKTQQQQHGGDKNVSVSDVAYNSFHRSLKTAMKRSIVKGVAAHGKGRAENMNAEKTRGGAMDGNVRLLISKAITNGLIQNCNGVVKEGKEAIVYHANGNTNDINSESSGFDVAVKVFKRIQEFKGRGAYMDGDPRYYGKKFSNVDKREQVELWTEKEYRNLIRANRSGVPVPTPIFQKENVLFMRFLGKDGWPAPQLREIELKKGSKKWTALYIQALVAIRRLFHCAKLIHSDLSEYNILISPMSQVENAFDKSEESKEDLQIVLIDFGQAVERRHPSAVAFLRRDLRMITSFFEKQGIMTLSIDDSEQFVLKEGIEECTREEQDGNTKIDTNVDEHCVNKSSDNDAQNINSSWDDARAMKWIETKLIRLP